jgi:hypothetical protein
MRGATCSGPRPRRHSGRIHTAAESSAALATVPLPWPPTDAPREGRRPHAHRCFDCSAEFRCPGPDETGACAPICAPCYWLELGRQVRTYRAVIAALNRKRRKIEKAVGASVCQKSQAHRRRNVQTGAIIAGFGNVMMRRNTGTSPQTALKNGTLVHASTDHNQPRKRVSRRGSLTKEF